MPSFDEDVAQHGSENTGDSSWSDGSGFWPIGKQASPMNLGFRVTTAAIAKGSTYSQADFQFGVHTVSASPTNVALADIHCSDEDDAAALSSSRRPSQLTLTTATYVVTADAFSVGNDQVIEYLDELKEVTDRAGWVSNKNFVGVCIGKDAGVHDFVAVNGNVTFATETPAPPEFAANWTEPSVAVIRNLIFY